MKLKHYIIGIVIVIIDQLSKMLIINKKIPVIPNFLEFNYTQNTGGAFGIGNFIDRFFRGYVIDFIDINILDFPNFNIADISIVSGVIVLLYIILLKSTNDNEN